MRSVRVALLAVGVFTWASCAPSPTTRQAVVVPPAVLPPTAVLRDELARIFSPADLEHALVAVKVQSVATGEILFERNATRAVIPASTAKLITIAAAAERLGWTYRYETRLVASGRLQSGVIKGDLLVIGSGDPSINDHHGGSTPVFARWAEQLRNAGIHAIEGRLIGDDRAFGRDLVGDGWSWDDLGDAYGSPVGALQVDENVVKLALRPADAPGKPVVIDLPPSYSWFEIVNRAVTASADAKGAISLRRKPGTSALEVSGQIPVGLEGRTRGAAVVHPTELFLRAMFTVLRERGVSVAGWTTAPQPDSTSVPSELRTVGLHESPPLQELATVMMKRSHNGYAETLLRTLGRTSGQGQGTAASGLEVVQEVLHAWGIPRDAYVLRDGSGMSRLNLATADILVTVLRQAHLDPRHREAFASTLPVAGRDGTLQHRMVGTPAEGKVVAKTGTMTGVRALAGYIETADGEILAFAMIANNFVVPVKSVDATMEAALITLAGFSRRVHATRPITAASHRPAASAPHR
jgi:serine-type D-Ala-D-Ala carboxypeptidase/endopeptidase (penicillin-binding protein 4)